MIYWKLPKIIERHLQWIDFWKVKKLWVKCTLTLIKNIDITPLTFAIFLFRSSHRRCSIKNCVLRNFSKFTGKHLCQSHLCQRSATLLEKRLWHRCFLVNFDKFLRTLFLQNTSGRLLLFIIRIELNNQYIEFCYLVWLLRESFISLVYSLG